MAKDKAGVTPSGIYTFASPRVGNKAFRNAYTSVFGKRTQRFTHRNDIVPMVPSCVSYRHVGQWNYLSGRGKLSRNKKVKLKDARCTAAGGDITFSSHNMTRYMSQLHQGMPAKIRDRMPLPFR